MKTIDGIKNALLLTPDEAAGVGLFDPLFVDIGSQVDVWRTLGMTSPCMVGGTDLAAIGQNQSGFLLCVRREHLPEVGRLRKELDEWRERYGYADAFLLWEAWVRN